MSSPSSPIENISDTALWVAYYRAMESERPDALFHDPYARLLAGERGKEIVRTMCQGKASSWAMVVRTKVLDEIIVQGFSSISRPNKLAHRIHLSSSIAVPAKSMG